jgi:CRISPR/Cas system-associated exonuclease Cas4 (RecB family)
MHLEVKIKGVESEIQGWKYTSPPSEFKPPSCQSLRLLNDSQKAEQCEDIMHDILIIQYYLMDIYLPW